MTAQERHDAVRAIARDETLSDAEALRRIAKLTPPSCYQQGRRCAFCGCSESDPCDDAGWPCHWAERQPVRICSLCVKVARVVAIAGAEGRA